MLRVIFLFLAFNTCALPVLAVGSGQSVAQSAGSSAEQQIYDRYRDWASGVPVDQRGAGLLTLYRQHLQKQAVPISQRFRVSRTWRSARPLRSPFDARIAAPLDVPRPAINVVLNWRALLDDRSR